MLPARPGAALERADEAVDLLLDAGREPGEILVLTSGEPHPWQQHELSFGEERYWAQLAEGGDVFYAGLELGRPARREVVVLVLETTDAGSAVLAVERARGHAVSLLLVCGATGGLAGDLTGDLTGEVAGGELAGLVTGAHAAGGQPALV
ncbi:hypothetical protein [Streptomyces tateyamensis]|uniref:hypothetical protein n=1 Tax=Streptomyces tateyamensis TaxID=565073 RepID=UPI0026C098A6